MPLKIETIGTGSGMVKEDYGLFAELDGTYESLEGRTTITIEMNSPEKKRSKSLGQNVDIIAISSHSFLTEKKGFRHVIIINPEKQEGTSPLNEFLKIRVSRVRIIQ